MSKIRLLARLAAAVPLMLAAFAAVAQQAYPSRVIRMIVPFGAGGPADIVARSIAEKMTESMKQPVVIENRPGADTLIAMELVAKAPADGYTLVYAIGSALTMNPTLYSKLPYDAAADFAPVSLVAFAPLSLVVHPSVPARTARELAEYIRANPGKLFYGQVNTVAKIATESFALAAGGKMVEVPYKTSAQNVQDLVRGEVKVAIEPVATVLPFVQRGDLRMLALTGSKRSAVLPDMPTVAEAGVPGFAFDNWHSILAPAATPKEIVQRLQEEIRKAASSPDLATRVAPLGIEMVSSTPQELQQRVRSEREHWDKQIKTLGIRIN
jgi:tripartite-type tricarboxylate transporter receptor subunit TctC